MPALARGRTTLPDRAQRDQFGQRRFQAVSHDALRKQSAAMTLS
jgi:hypothetical protein